MVQINKKILQVSFTLFFILSVISLYLSPTRPGYYFLLITVLFCIIFLQIFSDTLNPKIILFEIDCVLGNIIFGLTLKYPLFFGFTDIISHLYLTKITMLSGHIIPADSMLVILISHFITYFWQPDRIYWREIYEFHFLFSHLFLLSL